MFTCVSEITEDIQHHTQENQESFETPLCEQSFDRVFERFEPIPYPQPLFETPLCEQSFDRVFERFEPIPYPRPPFENTRYVPPSIEQMTVPPPVTECARFKEYMYTWFQKLADDNRHLHDILKYELSDKFDYTTLFDKDPIVCAEKIFQRWHEFDLVPRDMSRVTMTRGSSANRQCIPKPYFVFDEQCEFDTDSDTSE
jgi:hypothetical protein